MLDRDLKNQLTQLLLGLKSPLAMVVSGEGHAKFEELVTFLSEVASCSPFLSVEKKIGLPSEFETTGLGFSLSLQGKPLGAHFAGIPGGHEFSSLVLALLQSQGLGRRPDAGLQKQILSLKGPVRIRTFVSLSCENCPDVVQSLNQMALMHPDFHHVMIDGDLAQLEVQRLGIGSVPAVCVGDELILSGRVEMAALLEKLQQKFGQAQANSETSIAESQPSEPFDVLVVGGGPAGVSAAIYSVRKGLRTALVAERLGGQVKDTKGIENLISTPYTEGPKLTEDLRAHLESYDVTVFEHRRVQEFDLKSDLKSVRLSTGEQLRFRRMIFATGAKWRELGVPGEKEYLGKGVAFCPHCDGPLYKGKPVAVVGGGNSGVEAAIDLANICSKVTLIEFASDLKADKVLVDKLLSLKNVEVLKNTRTIQVKGDGLKVSALELENRSNSQKHTLSLDGVFVQIGLIPNSQSLREHVETNRFGEVVVDVKGRTNVPGVYAAGDVTTVPYKQIVISIGEGAKAALTAFEDQMLAAPHS
jgi:NADH-dependent peroxiredoxin subunit F